MRIITVEEHYAIPAFLRGPGCRLEERVRTHGNPLAQVIERLCDLGEQRIAEMDAEEIDVHVLSLPARRTTASRRRCESTQVVLPDLPGCRRRRPMQPLRNSNARCAITGSKAP